jgi:hypothetical protein
MTPRLARRPKENGIGDVFGRAVEFAKDNPLLVVAGASAVAIGGIALGAYLLQRGDNVIIYLDEGEGSGEFRTVANRMAGTIGASVYPAHNGQQILDALNRHRRIKTLILAGHGTTTQFLRPGRGGIRVGTDALPTWISTGTLARVLSFKMVHGGVISWAGCSAASNPGESSWSYLSYGPGGERSFIAKVRDDMARLPWTSWGIEHRGHASPGHTTANPAGRVCNVSMFEIGQPCDSLMDEEWGEGSYESQHRAWADVFEGQAAEAWMAGADVSVPRGASAEVRYA